MYTKWEGNMSEKIKRLPDAELEIMLAVWSAGDEAVSASFILDRIKDTRKWQLQSLLTVLTRMVNKGILVCEKRGRFNFYRAVISKEAYEQAEGKSILEKLYDNSFKNMVNSLLNSKAITKKDLKELYECLDEDNKEGE